MTYIYINSSIEHIITERLFRDLNTISQWLALDSRTLLQEVTPDLIILAGNSILPTIYGILEYAASVQKPLLITGGKGHSTSLLYEAISHDPLLSFLKVDQQGESVLIGEIAQVLYNVPKDHLILEENSRNCGENADFTRDLLLSLGVIPHHILIVQDPLLQRRTLETFKTSWERKGLCSHFISWPVFVPSLHLIEGHIKVSGLSTQSPQGIWSLERYISLILGEIKRLRNDQDGYGPQGTGFIGAVDIPDSVEAAWQSLVHEQGLGFLVRSS